MSIRLTIYPDECDAFGHLNQASYLALFERARWELLARGPGMDVFAEAGVWPAVRRATIDYHAGAWPGDVLEFSTALAGRGRTSFTLRQEASRTRDGKLVAALETVFVCIDRQERPVEVPAAVLAALTAAPRRTTLPSGTTIAWEAAGHEGIPVLFVHGYPLDRSMWQNQLVGITGHRLIAPDLRGFGDSSEAAAPDAMEAHASDLVALLDALAIDRAVVVGLSMGGYVALAMAERHRDRLAGLVLMDTRAGADDADGRAGRDAAIATIREKGAGPVLGGLADKLFAESTAAGVREAVAQRMGRVAPATLVASLAAMRDRPDRRPVLAGLAGLPTLVIVGTEDRITPPAVAREMAAAVAGAELVEVEGAAHLPPLERPATVNEALQAFLDRLGRGV